MNIVVVGSLNMDLVVRTPRHPAIGETIIGSSFQTFPGGKGANQAVAAARLGGSVRMIGRVGADAFGEALLQTVAADGVDTRYILRDQDAATGVALITVDDLGQNSIVVASGANACLTAQDVSAAERAFQGANLLLLQLETPLPAIQQAVSLARRHGMRVVLNPAPARPLPPDLLAEVDYLVPNQNELNLLTGLPDVSAAAQQLHAQGVQTVVVTLGEAGALLIDQTQTRQVPAFPVQVVDTTAAGDAFVGAFGVALTEGLSPLEAVHWGNAAGALAVTRPGAQPSLPRRDELDRFIAQAQPG